MSRRRIGPEPDSMSDFFRKVWDYRMLIWIFAVRDIKVKYAQTSLGLAWSLLQPLTSLLIFTFFFKHLLEWSSGELPFVLYVLSGLLGWNFFSYLVSSGTISVQESSHLIKKIYFPKSVLPLSKIIVAGLELAVSLFLLLALMVYYEQGISINIVFLPFVLLYNCMCALTIVFWMAAFGYRRRDVFHIYPYIVYFGIWLTPVFFTKDILPEGISHWLLFNPMANVVELWRWSIFGHGVFSWMYVANFVLIVLMCVTGMAVFNRNEHRFSDFA